MTTQHEGALRPRPPALPGARPQGYGPRAAGGTPQARLTARWAGVAPLAILAVALAFDLDCLFPEARIRAAPPDDRIVHGLALGRRGGAVASRRGATDPWIAAVPGKGYSALHHYQHMPRPLPAASHLPATKAPAMPRSLPALLNALTYPRLRALPLFAYWRMRGLGSPYPAAALAAVAAAGAIVPALPLRGLAWRCGGRDVSHAPANVGAEGMPDPLGDRCQPIGVARAPSSPAARPLASAAGQRRTVVGAPLPERGLEVHVSGEPGAGRHLTCPRPRRLPRRHGTVLCPRQPEGDGRPVPASQANAIRWAFTGTPVRQLATWALRPALPGLLLAAAGVHGPRHVRGVERPRRRLPGASTPEPVLEALAAAAPARPVRRPDTPEEP